MIFYSSTPTAGKTRPNNELTEVCLPLSWPAGRFRDRDGVVGSLPRFDPGRAGSVHPADDLFLVPGNRPANADCGVGLDPGDNRRRDRSEFPGRGFFVGFRGRVALENL